MNNNPIHVVKIPALYLDYDTAEEAAEIIRNISEHAMLHGQQEVDITYFLDYVINREEVRKND